MWDCTKNYVYFKNLSDADEAMLRLAAIGDSLRVEQDVGGLVTAWIYQFSGVYDPDMKRIPVNAQSNWQTLINSTNYDLQIFISPEVPVSSLPFSVSQFKADFSVNSQTPEWTLEGTASPYTLKFRNLTADDIALLTALEVGCGITVSGNLRFDVAGAAKLNDDATRQIAVSTATAPSFTESTYPLVAQDTALIGVILP